MWSGPDGQMAAAQTQTMEQGTAESRRERRPPAVQGCRGGPQPDLQAHPGRVGLLRQAGRQSRTAAAVINKCTESSLSMRAVFFPSCSARMK